MTRGGWEGRFPSLPSLPGLREARTWHVNREVRSARVATEGNTGHWRTGWQGRPNHRNASVHLSRSFLGLLTSMLTGQAVISAAGKGRSSASSFRLSWHRGSSQRA